MPAYSWFPAPTHLDRWLLAVAVSALRAVAFWAAILLVLVYPVALVLPTVPLEHVLALILTHAAAVVLGHEHARRQD